MKRIDDYVIIEEGINKAVTQGRTDLLGIYRTIPLEAYRQANYKEKKKLIINHLKDAGESPQKFFKGVVESLRTFEKLLYATDKIYRDHIFHTFRVWGLGLYLYHNGLRQVIDKRKQSHFHFTWYPATLYHDMGFPISRLEEISKGLEESFSFLQCGKLVNFDKIINVLNEESLNNDLKKIFPNKSHELDQGMLEQRHGLTSARLLLFSLRRHLREFSQYVYPAIKAIGKHDSDESIVFSDEPFSALLVICDELQEWGRTHISPVLEDRYITTDHIELDLEIDGSEPCIRAMIDYRERQSGLENMLGWNGEILEQKKRKNLERLCGINIEVKMKYNK